MMIMEEGDEESGQSIKQLKVITDMLLAQSREKDIRMKCKIKLHTIKKGNTGELTAKELVKIDVDLDTNKMDMQGFVLDDPLSDIESEDSVTRSYSYDLTGGLAGDRAGIDLDLGEDQGSLLDRALSNTSHESSQTEDDAIVAVHTAAAANDGKDLTPEQPLNDDSVHVADTKTALKLQRKQQQQQPLPESQSCVHTSAPNGVERTEDNASPTLTNQPGPESGESNANVNPDAQLAFTEHGLVRVLKILVLFCFKTQL